MNKNFEALTEAAKVAAARPEWSEYGKYCELLALEQHDTVNRERRDAALSHLNLFIEKAVQWSFADRREFIRWLLQLDHYIYRFSSSPERIARAGSDLLKYAPLKPRQLYERLIAPTLHEWVELEPTNAEACCWNGFTPRAIMLDPANELYREIWINRLLAHTEQIVWNRRAEYHQNLGHHLPNLDEAEKHLAAIQDSELNHWYKVKIANLRKEITDMFNAVRSV